ncbi:hypothetical protein PIIN_10190 [Serendipita indica DSM 11827]|uniref:Uncharacterized protein n=1 Tax=Serendipita indica (strain DSM 11827) TaxID=1109443 RepID=G4TY04_SERID|nr:hypothetical protein PIIN_10190 [Serendipita indica DSM 11827]
MLAAEVTSFNMEKRADLVLYDVVQAPGGGALRIRIVYEGKGGDSNETLTNALTQCEAFAAAQVRDQLANGDVCFFIAAKGTKAKMRVAKRLDRDINSKALKATVNPGGLVTMSNGGENNAEAGTEIDVSTASGRDIVHAAMARMVVQLGAKNYIW